jgi:hypothetical protein
MSRTRRVRGLQRFRIVRYAITCVTVMAVTYILMSPFRLASQGISRITGGLLTHDDD